MHCIGKRSYRGGNSRAALLFELFTTITLKNKILANTLILSIREKEKQQAKTNKSSPGSSRESSPEEYSPNFPIAKEG